MLTGRHTRRPSPSLAAGLAGLFAGATALALVVGAPSSDAFQTEKTAMQTNLAAALLQDPPEGYAEAMRRSVSVDGRAAELVRFERADGRNAGLGGEHVSLLRAEGGVLLGLTRMRAEFAERSLPDEEAAERAALVFLERAAPDLTEVRQVQWIKPHAEPVRVTGEDGTVRSVDVTGMKVKMRNADDGTYFWVIVGPDDEVVTFERDIVWATLAGRRTTEKWLHDSWRAVNAPPTEG